MFHTSFVLQSSKSAAYLTPMCDEQVAVQLRIGKYPLSIIASTLKRIMRPRRTQLGRDRCLVQPLVGCATAVSSPHQCAFVKYPVVKAPARSFLGQAQFSQNRRLRDSEPDGAPINLFTTQHHQAVSGFDTQGVSSENRHRLAPSLNYCRRAIARHKNTAHSQLVHCL